VEHRLLPLIGQKKKIHYFGEIAAFLRLLTLAGCEFHLFSVRVDINGFCVNDEISFDCFGCIDYLRGKEGSYPPIEEGLLKHSLIVCG